MNVPEPIRRVCKWSIDASRVEGSDETWSVVYHKQMTAATLIISVITLWIGWLRHTGQYELSHTLVATGFVICACLPVAGAYLYMAERGDGQ